MSLCINPKCPQPQNFDNHLFCQACGSELLLAGRYRVIKLLSGKGGFADTYEVVEGEEKKVLKVLTNNHPHAVELFKQEELVLSQLNHPGIPQGEGYFTYFSRNNEIPMHCLVMEKIEGIDLEEYQKQRQNRPIDEKLAIKWLMQLTNILEEVHSKNFFHRDIKPSNIILKPDGQLVLIDFGAVRQVTSTILAGGKNTGIFTPGYAPPEQEKGYAVQQSDFYALGRTFVYLLTGKEPNDPKVYDLYSNEFHWRNYANNISHEFADLIDRLISEKVKDRPANTREINKILSSVKVARTHLGFKKISKILPTIIVSRNQESSSGNQPILKAKLDLENVNYAGFWVRWQALVLDTVIVTLLSAFFGKYLSYKLSEFNLIDGLFTACCNGEWQYYLLMGLGTTSFGLAIVLLDLFSVVLDLDYLSIFSENVLPTIWLSIIIKWLYSIVLEASWLKGTLGKKILGISVTDLEGNRISFLNANQRYWSKLLSVSLIYLGFMLAGWTKRKRALHDFLSGTITIRHK